MFLPSISIVLHLRRLILNHSLSSSMTLVPFSPPLQLHPMNLSSPVTLTFISIVKMLRRPFMFWLYSCKIWLLTLIDSPICTWWLVELFVTKTGNQPITRGRFFSMINWNYFFRSLKGRWHDNQSVCVIRTLDLLPLSFWVSSIVARWQWAYDRSSAMRVGIGWSNVWGWMDAGGSGNSRAGYCQSLPLIASSLFTERSRLFSVDSSADRSPQRIVP